MACSRRLDCGEQRKAARYARVGAREDWESPRFFLLRPDFSFARHKLNAWNKLKDKTESHTHNSLT